MFLRGAEEKIAGTLAKLEVYAYISVNHHALLILEIAIVPYIKIKVLDLCRRI